MKQEILELLKNSLDYVSGQKISNQLNISRVMVWKHIQGLIKTGYQIQTSNHGYKLIPGEDLLVNWEFTGFEKLIHYKAEVDSTMNWAKVLANKGCESGTVVIAGCQTNGKGRFNRDWDSQLGGLFFTIILRPTLSLEECYLYNFACAIALAKTFREKYNLEAFIKWPNDILVKDKKISGILLELAGEPGSISYLNIGAGINVNNKLNQEITRATTLSEETGSSISRKDLFISFYQSFNDIISSISKPQILNDFKKMNSTLGRDVSVNLKNGSQIQGFAMDINENGALLLRKSDGVIEKIYFGDCTYL